MTTYGMTDAGFVPMTLQILRAAVNSAVQAVYGASFDVSDESVAGHFIGIMCERFALLWEIGEVSFSSIDPDQASGAMLRALCKITGTIPKDPAPSRVDLTLVGDVATVVAAGALSATASTNVKFKTIDDATIAALTAWAPTTAYAKGDRVTASFRAYQCVTAGTSDVSAPSTTSLDITDGTVHWRYLGEGSGAVDVNAASVDDGPVVAVSGDISVIVTPVGGWKTVVNLLDATPGRLAMTDEQLRLLREQELARAGSSPADSIRAKLIQIPDVTAATVFQNVTDSTNSDGMPPHSVEAMIQGGADQDIADSLWANVAAGIVTTGNQPPLTVVDSEGTSQSVEFSRPEEKPIYLDITLVKNPKTYGGDDQVRGFITAWGNAQATGKDAVASAVTALAFIADGVLDVTSVKLGLAPSPTLSVTVPISLRQLAKYDSSRITIHTTDGVP